MQRPRQEILALTGVTTVSGVTSIAVSTGDDEMGIEPGGLLPLVCLTTAAIMTVIRHAMLHLERRLRALSADLSRVHDRHARALDARERDLAEREKSFQLVMETTNLRVENAFARVDRLLNERATAHLRYAELRFEYDQLAREYNELALEAAGSKLPVHDHPRAVAVGQTLPSDDHGPRHPGRYRGPRPSLIVVDGLREQQDTG
ncbi:hypothetical protein GTY54_22320 [Streptomyces sp. SID625]|nr:hypothetical protein [Streptomyces sp. SID625]